MYVLSLYLTKKYVRIRTVNFQYVRQNTYRNTYEYVRYVHNRIRTYFVWKYVRIRTCESTDGAAAAAGHWELKGTPHDSDVLCTATQRARDTGNDVVKQRNQGMKAEQQHAKQPGPGLCKGQYCHQYQVPYCSYCHCIVTWIVTVA